MGIKTKFNPMGGATGDKGKLDEWRYSTADNGQITLYEYLGNYNAIKPVYVPKKGGKTIINNYVSGTTTTASNTPFYGNPNVISVDLQKVPYKGNSMYNAFRNCQNLIEVKNINPSVTNMGKTFSYCTNFNQPVTIGNSVIDMAETFYRCYNFNQPITIPNSVTNMANTFQNCISLNQPVIIGSSVTSMANTFRSCSNFNQPITISDSVVSMMLTFEGCYNFNQPITIPDSVTSMYETFYHCTNFNQPITIGNSVIDMREAFSNCQNFNQPITIPDSVVSMNLSFSKCYNFNQPITIGNSVTYMTSTFSNCQNFNQPITIPDSVTRMDNTFTNCIDLTQNIYINSINVTNSYNCFYGSGLAKNVIFPSRYINNAFTPTRTSLVTAATGGYAVGTAAGNLVNNTAQNAVFYAYDPIAWEGYNTWVGNGTHWQLQKWAGIGKNPATTEVTVPNAITSYDTFPTAMNYMVFSGNTAITNVTIEDDIPWATQIGNYKNSKSRYGAFNACTGLQEIHWNVPAEITVLDHVFMGCTSLVNADVNFYNTAGVRSTDLFGACTSLEYYNHPLPETLTSMWTTFGSCSSLKQAPIIPPNVTVMQTCFDACTSLRGDIYIKSPVVSNIVNVFRGYNGELQKNIYLPYLYDNGVYTATYGQFNANAVFKNNATSNFYMYDSSPYNYLADYVVAINSTAGLTNLTTYRGMSEDPIVITNGFPGTNIQLMKTTYRGNTIINSVDIGAEIPWDGNTIGTGTNAKNRTGAFKGCTNLHSISGIIGDGITDATSLFEGCTNLTDIKVAFPDSITKWYVSYLQTNAPHLPPFGLNTANIQQCFYQAVGLTDYPIIPPKVTAMVQAFYGCSNCRGNMFVLSPSIASANAAVAGAFVTGYNASLQKNIHMYYKYSNGTNTVTYATFTKNAIYRTTANGASPMMNTTSNFYLYNLSSEFEQIWSTYWGTTSTELLKYNIAQEIEHIAAFAQYPDYTVVNIGVNCFEDASNLKTIALYNIPFNTSVVANAFRNCYNLQLVQGLNLTGAVNLSRTFANCRNLNQNIQIPNTVNNLSFTFSGCTNYAPNVSNLCNGCVDLINANSAFRGTNIKDATNTFSGCTNLVDGNAFQDCSNLESMAGTFRSCSNFNQPITIPNSVTNMVSTFYSCRNYNQPIIIPNSVTNMASTFFFCTSFNQPITIPNSVINMYGTFNHCTELNQPITIGNSVTNMANAFCYCQRLSKDITILSNQVIEAHRCFYSTSIAKNVLIPFKYSNGVNSATFNSFVAAGYLYANGTSKTQNGVTVYDLNA